MKHHTGIKQEIKDLLQAPENRRMLFVTAAFLLLIVVLTLILLPYINRLSEPETQAAFKQWVAEMGALGWFAMLGLQFLQVVLAFIPGEPVEILAGVLYGTWGGWLVCLVGCVCASSLVFFVSRRLGKALLYRLFGEARVNGWRWVQDNRKIELVVFLLFFIPGTPKDMLTYIVGISNLRWLKFIILSSLARIPSVLTSCMIGATMRQGRWELSILVFVLTGVLGLVGILYKDRVIQYCKNFSQRRHLFKKKMRK